MTEKKQEDYELLTRQIRSLAEISLDETAILANASALLYESMPDVNWAGFYLLKDGALIVGPFQGRPACVRIEKGRGVCGTSWAEDRTLTVPDVHEFPGHIACDSASNSEIVVPLHRNGEVFGVLDIDSPLSDRFSEADQKGLRAFAEALEDLLKG